MRLLLFTLFLVTGLWISVDPCYAQQTTPCPPVAPLPTSLPASVPMPCDKSIAAYAPGKSTYMAGVQQCSTLFDHCESATIINPPGLAAGPGPGIAYDIMDSIIRQVVETRINNLYLGVDGLQMPTSATDSAWLREQSVLTNSGGFGSCAHAGACNPFCGEGDVTSSVQFQGPIPTPLAPPTQGGHGFMPNQGRTNLFSGLGNYVNSSALSVKASDFWAKGVLTNPDGSGLSGNSPPSGPLPTSSPNTPDGWPIQNFPGSTWQSGPNLCAGSPPADQPSFGNHDAYHTTAMGQLSKIWSFEFQTFTWNDTSYPYTGSTAPGANQTPSAATIQSEVTTIENQFAQALTPMDKQYAADLLSNNNNAAKSDLQAIQSMTNTENNAILAVASPSPNVVSASGATCDMSYTADFSTASTMAALQTGAMVQATWMALDQVLNELKNNNYILNITDPVCGAMAQTFLGDLQQASNSLCASTAECSETLATIQKGCPQPSPTPPVYQTPQSDCQKLALIGTVQTTDFPTIAMCEIQSRAASLYFTNAMISPNGSLWNNQLKSYAVTACMHQAGSDLFGELPDIHNSACTAIWTAPCFGVAALCIPLGGAIGYGLCFAACVSGLYYGIIQPSDVCLTDTGNALDNEISNAYPVLSMANCFPYAYSAAFKAYLTALGFAQVPVQNSYSSVRQLDGKPILSINNCQVTDRSPTFVIPTKPSY